MAVRDFLEECVSRPWITAGEGVQYRIDVDETRIEVYFQGSASKSDWRHNFDFPAVPYKRMAKRWWAHRGFVRLWKSVQDVVMGDIINAWMGKSRDIVIAGHSQGAALALLCYEDILWRGIPQERVRAIGFGTPRVFFLKVPRRVKGFERWNARGDIVSKLPPAFMGFRHAGVNHKIGPARFFSVETHEPAYYDMYLPKE